jgi:hypothetical protein
MSYAFYLLRILVWVASIICVLGVLSFGFFVFELDRHKYPNRGYIKVLFSLWLVGQLLLL